MALALLVAGACGDSTSDEGRSQDGGAGSDGDASLPACETGDECCAPDCNGRECGPDPVCGSSCGQCAVGACTLEGQCLCAGSCADLGATCGTVTNGCGDALECGACFTGMSCETNVCTIPGCSGQWSVEDVLAPGLELASGGGIHVDQAGTVHAVVSGGAYYLKKPIGGQWSITPLGLEGANASLAGEKSGTLHLSWFDASSGAVSVSSLAAGSDAWTTTKVDEVGPGYGQDTTSVFVDPAGGLSVRYLSYGVVKYARRGVGATAFDKEIVGTPVVETGSFGAGANAMAVDDGGGAHVVYFDSDHGVTYASRAFLGDWVRESLDDEATSSEPAWLAVDDKEGVHVLYLAQGGNELRRQYKPTGGSWTERTVRTGDSAISGISLAVSHVGTVHVGYRYQQKLHFAQFAPTATTSTFENVLDTDTSIGGASVGMHAHFVLDSKGGVHGLYERDSHLAYAYRCPGACSGKTCEELGAECGSVFDGCKLVECGSCVPPAACGTGTPNVCCTPTTCAAEGKECGFISDGCGGQELCGTCALGEYCGTDVANVCAACTPGQWVKETTSTLDQAGLSQVAVDSVGNPHFVYYEFYQQEVKLADFAPVTGWQTSVVDPMEGNQGALGISLVMDPNDGMHAVYSPSEGENIVRYASKPAGGPWTTSDIAVGLQSPTRTALQRDASGGLHVAYYDGNVGQVVWAYRAPSGGNWTKQNVAAGGSALVPNGIGEFVSLAVEAGGGVHVVHSRTDPILSLRHAYRPPGGTFTSDEIVSGASVQPETSVAIDGQGRMHVAYAEPTLVRHAYQLAGGTWTTEVVGTASYAWPWMGVDTNDQLHVLYTSLWLFDGELRHARKPVGGAWTSEPLASKASRMVSGAFDGLGGLHASFAENGYPAHAYRCAD